MPLIWIRQGLDLDLAQEVWIVRELMGSESMALKQCLEIPDPDLECRALSLSGYDPDSFAQKSLKISSIIENVDAASTI